MWKQEPWSLFSVNLLEWYLGVTTVLTVSLFFSTPARAMPFMFLTLIASTYGLAKLRRRLRESKNQLIENVLLVWDIGKLKPKLSSVESARTVSASFLAIGMGLYLLKVLVSGGFSTFYFALFLAGLAFCYRGNLKNPFVHMVLKLIPIFCIELHLLPLYLLVLTIALPFDAVPLAISLGIVAWRTRKHLGESGSLVNSRVSGTI